MGEFTTTVPRIGILEWFHLNDYDHVEWRKGDQKYYISDTSKFSKATGWRPVVSAKEGIQILFEWLNSFYHFNVLNKPAMEEFQTKH